MTHHLPPLDTRSTARCFEGQRKVGSPIDVAGTVCGGIIGSRPFESISVAAGVGVDSARTKSSLSLGIQYSNATSIDDLAGNDYCGGFKFGLAPSYGAQVCFSVDGFKGKYTGTWSITRDVTLPGGDSFDLEYGCTAARYVTGKDHEWSNPCLR
jgi:hypothetical protein